MKCVVPGANVKTLAKAIHTLAKIGDELYVYPRENALSFRTVNLANSAYADITFFDGYFSYYLYEDLDEEDTLKCKISMRSAMTVFKTPNTLDKQVETCHIILTTNASDILFILKYKNSITKRHLLPILDPDKVQANYSKSSASNEVQSQARVLSDAVQNIQQNQMEITLQVTPQKMLLRNYIDDVTGASNTTRTQLALSVGEFEKYTIGTDTTITFCMKELKAILGFAEVINIPVSIHFDTAGRPVIFVLKSQTFEANIVLSTLNPDADTQTDTTLSSKVEKQAKKRTDKQTKKSIKGTSKRTRNHSKNSTGIQNSLHVTLHPALTERMPDPRPSTSNGRISMDSCQQEPRRFSRDVSQAGASIHKSDDAASSEKKQLVNSIFSTITKRKSTEKKEENFEDAVPNSPPPAKKARMVFQKCFQTTFDPRMLPGHNVILVEDSDECSD